MSTYRRSEFLKRCQRWTGQTWEDCAFDEPETRVRKKGEGMVVGPLVDPDAQGPLVIRIDDLLMSQTNRFRG